MNTLKVLIYLKNFQKPIVFTCGENENRKSVSDKVNTFMKGESDTISFDSGDIFFGNRNEISAITITTDKIK